MFRQQLGGIVSLYGRDSARRGRTGCQRFEGFCHLLVTQAAFGSQHLLVNRFPRQCVPKLIALVFLVRREEGLGVVHLAHQLGVHGSAEHCRQLTLIEVA